MDANGLYRWENLLPLRGRWLRYFQRTTAVVLLIWWGLDGSRQWSSLLTLLSADRHYVDSEFASDWRFYCGGGMSLGGFTATTLHLGPWVLSWLAPNFTQSPLEQLVRGVLRVVTLGTATGLLIRWLLQSVRLPEAEEPLE